MFDETLKLFMSGYGLDFKLLRRFGLFAFIIPQTSRIIEQGDNFALRLVERPLNTDLRICNKQRITQHLFMPLCCGHRLASWRLPQR